MTEISAEPRNAGATTAAAFTAHQLGHGKKQPGRRNTEVEEHVDTCCLIFRIFIRVGDSKTRVRSCVHTRILIIRTVLRAAR